MTLILFILIFGIVVVSHEFGHFLLAKVNGIHVVEFSVGMGPKLLAFKRKETLYTLRLLPIGGACMFEGEDGLNKKEEGSKGGSFPEANVWARISTVLAGPLFNVILAFIVACLMSQLIVVRDPVVSQLVEGSPAQEAGLLAGDRIVGLNNEKIYLYEEISLFMQMNKEKPVQLKYIRDGVAHETILTPQYVNEDGRYLIGIINDQVVHLEGFDFVKYGWYHVRFAFINTYKSLLMLVSGQVTRQDVAGPVGIAVNVVGKVYEETKESPMDVFVNMLNIILILSVNLGVLNLLPLPALDGGRLVFLFIEVLRGKPISPEKEGLVHFAGMVFFMALMVFIFFNDLMNIFS